MLKEVSRQAMAEEYNCKPRELDEIITSEHSLLQKLRASALSDDELLKLVGGGNDESEKSDAANLSGLIYCQDCGNKVRLAWNSTTNGSKKKPRKYLRHNYNCTSYMKFGKRYCSSHYIKMQDMDAIVIEDIRSLAQLVVEDEEKAKAEFLTRKTKHHESSIPLTPRSSQRVDFACMSLTH